MDVAARYESLRRDYKGEDVVLSDLLDAIEEDGGTPADLEAAREWWAANKAARE